MTYIIVPLLVLTLIAAVLTPLFLFRRLRKHQSDESRRLISKLDQNLGASLKLLEVRNYYQDASAALKKMLDAAYKEGNRFRQDEIRKLIERLQTLKVRVLDKAVRILEGDGDRPPRSRRRRSRRTRKPDRSQQSPDTKNRQPKKP